MSKEEIIKEVISILETSDYVDPAEHLYDGLKQIKREITYSTVHDFLWALESSTVIDFDGKVAECANKIKPLLADMTIDEAYDNYTKSLIDSITFSERGNHFKSNGLEFNSGYPNYIHYTQEEFINKCKTDTEFSEKWGLTIEERELSLEERIRMYALKEGQTYEEFVTNWNTDEQWSEDLSDKTIPNKIITITYNNKTIESYE